MTVRDAGFLDFLYDNRGGDQFYANPADEFRGHDESARNDPRDNNPYWGVDHDRSRDDDYHYQEMGLAALDAASLQTIVENTQSASMYSGVTTTADLRKWQLYAFDLIFG